MGKGEAVPPALEERGRSAIIILIKDFSQFLLTFVLLSSLLENCEFHEVDGRQSSEALEHLLSFIGSFSDIVESVIL